MSKRSKLALFAIAMLIGGLVYAIFFLPQNNLATLFTNPAVEQLELTRIALAATENLESAAADQAWSALFSQIPNDVSISLNRALNRVLLVDSLTELTSNATVSAEAKTAARQQLPTAIEQARSAIDAFATLSQDQVTKMWLQSRLDLQQASLLPTSVAKSLRREVFDRLVDSIEGDLKAEPKSIVLGGLLARVLDELESPTSGLPKEIQDRAASAMAALSDQHPDNLFIALRAARLNIDVKSERAADAVQRTIHLARAIEPTLRVQTQSIGLTPDDLVEKIVAAIKSKDWQTASNQMLLWFNVLNSTDLVKTDRRRSSPHPLDRLSFDIMRRLSVEVAKREPITSGNQPLRFDRLKIGDQADVSFAVPIDFDLDLDTDVVSFSSNAIATIWQNIDGAQWRNSGTLAVPGNFRGAIAADLFVVDASDSQRLQATPKQDETTLAVSSSRHTTLPSLLVYGSDGVRLISVDGRSATADNERLTVVEKPTGLEDVLNVTCAIAGDLEGDGDLDLVFATSNVGLRIFINRGNRTFFEARTPIVGDEFDRRDIAALAIADLDRDLDLDVVTLDGKTGRVGLLENLLHLQFRQRELTEIPVTEGARQISVAEIDGNISWDLIIGGGNETRVVYSQTADTGIWTIDRSELIGAASGRYLSGDFDNDSWLDVMSAKGKQSQLHRYAGETWQTGAVADVDLSGSVAVTADFNSDGLSDVLTVTDGMVYVYKNATLASGHHLDVRFRGIDDNNANSGRVNHYAIGSVIELRFGPHYRAAIITEPTTHFGLDGFDQAGSMRVIFPNGLTQTIREPMIDTLVEEEQTLKGSCPYLYAWDGEKYAFVTDCLWAAPLGLQVAAGVVAKDRPWEYLKVTGEHVKVRDSRYELRITEELWEVAYFDHLALTAIDHPQGVDVWTNEKVGPPEIAEPTIYAFAPENVLWLKHGQDTTQRDVTTELSSIDHNFVQGFDRRIRQGLCPPHWIDLDFGSPPRLSDDKAVIYLVLTGWILPTDTSLNIQIDQNPELPAIEYPSVWVPDAAQADGWRKAIPFMGFPGGKTKTIVVDVTSILNRDDPRLRVRTSAQLYWDCAQLVVQTDAAEVRSYELPLQTADLQCHGFSSQLKPSDTAPETFDYSRATITPKWPPLQGRFTQFGDCRKLLESWDNEMVVMGSGDEIRLSFDAPATEPPPGWKRDFVLHCVGWDKDADLNTLTGQSSFPLPFKSMLEYPPTQQQVAEQIDVKQLNDRHLQREQRFREFWAR